MYIDYEKYKNKILYTLHIRNYINNSNSNIIIESKFNDFISCELKLLYEHKIIDDLILTICFIYFKRFIYFGYINDLYINIVLALNFAIKVWQDQCRDLVYYINNIIYYEVFILKSKISLDITPELFHQTLSFLKE